MRVDLKMCDVVVDAQKLLPQVTENKKLTRIRINPPQIFKPPSLFPLFEGQLKQNLAV